MGFDTAKAGPIYALYVSSVYLLSVPGGWVADRVLGPRRTVFVGGVIIMMGHICLAVPSITTFYLGLALIASGTGLLKSNISVLVGKLYSPEDVRRDAGYSIYYMGINTGAFDRSDSSPAGWRRARHSSGSSPRPGWRRRTPGTGASVPRRLGCFWAWCSTTLAARTCRPTVCIRSGRAILPLPRRWTARYGSWESLRSGSRSALVVLVLGGLVAFDPEAISRNFKWVLMAVTVGFFAWLFLSSEWTREERKALVVIAVLFAAAVVFWMAYEQAGSTLNLFADRSTNNTVLGHSLPGELVPVASAALHYPLRPGLRQRCGCVWATGTLPVRPSSLSPWFSWDSASPIMIGAATAAAGGARVSPMWLVVSYLLQTLGELCLSPVGLSAMSRLAPARIAGLVMGVWFLALAVGNYLAGMASSFYETMPLPKLFTIVTATALIAALVLALLIKPIQRMLVRK